MLASQSLRPFRIVVFASFLLCFISSSHCAYADVLSDSLYENDDALVANLDSDDGVTFGSDDDHVPASFGCSAVESEDSEDFYNISFSNTDGLAVSSAHVGDRVRVSIASGSETKGFQFNYVWRYGDGWDDWSSTLTQSGSYSEEASCVFTPKKSGLCTFYVDVINEKGNLLGTFSAVLNVLEEWSCLGINQSASVISLGEEIALTPVLSGPDSNLARFNYIWRYGSGWGEWSSTIASTGDFTSDSSWSFAPKRAGFYSLYVDVVDTAGNKKTFELSLEVVSAWEAEGLNSDDSQYILGDDADVSVLFGASSNTLGLEFNFGWQYGDDWECWDSLAKNGTLSDENRYRVTLTRVGSYRLFADVIGTDGVRSTVSKVITVVPPYDYIGLDLSSTEITLGDSIDTAAVLDGDASSARYNFVWSHEGSWKEGDWSSTIKETGTYSENNSWTFTPGHSGDYIIYLDVVAADGSIDTKMSTVHVDSGFDVRGVRLNTSSSPRVGQEIKWSLDVDGPREKELLFNFVWCRDNWADWDSTIKQNNSFTREKFSSFIPNHSGSYRLYVDVYDQLSGDSKTYSLSVNVKKTWHLERLEVKYEYPLMPGSRVTWKPIITGDISGLRYNYVWSREEWSSWNSNVKDTGMQVTSNPGTYTIGSGDGTYNFYVDVIDENGEVETAQVMGVEAGTVLGVPRAEIVSWLSHHQNSNYYLKTPYSTGFSINTCMYPNGMPRADGFRGMNCTGFVAHVYRSCGGKLGPIGKISAGGGGSYINAWKWYYYAKNSGAKVYTFDSVAEMLASGKASKGDIIFFKTTGGVDCHIGFFWGDNPHENRMWHQIASGNVITNCFNNANRSERGQQTILIK